MLKRFGRRKGPDPVVFVVGALLCASTLVIFFHQRALGAIDRQTTIILQKVAEQTAAAVALEIRREFDGPVFDTLASINHPYLVANRLDLVARAYENGLRTYPQIDRFFVWTAALQTHAPDEAVFYGTPPDPVVEPVGAGLAEFHREPELGRMVVTAARRLVKAQQIYAAISAESRGRLYDAFIRIYYTGAARDRPLAVLGFVVDLEHVRTRLFEEIHRRHLANLLEPKDGTPPFEMRILDETGRQIFGPAGAPPPIRAHTRFAVQFYPADEIRTRMSAVLPDRSWTLVVSPRALSTPPIASMRLQSYLLSGVSVMLMLVALVVAIQTRQRSAQLARMQTEFVAHVSHQLKTPVSLLSAVTETVSLDRVRSPEKLSQCIAIIRSQTSRLSALVERILEFSRVADGQRKYELEAVRLEALVRETVDAFVEALAASGFAIGVTASGGSPIVAADPAALEQALLNLLDNAIKYSGDGREIAVHVGTMASEAFVEVIDHGIGVAAEERSRIVERFYRGTGATVHPGGFGLGLAITKEILTAHRGKLDVDDTPGGGSTFRMRLPVIQTAGAPARVRASSPWWRRRET
jgi:signal transduction histidine kinase